MSVTDTRTQTKRGRVASRQTGRDNVAVGANGHTAAERGQEVLVALRRIIQAIDMHSKRLTKQDGLTIPQVLVLQSIRDLGEVTTRELSKRVTLSQGTVTTILDRLERRALIERYRSTTDRRIVHARLTAQGRDVLRRAPPLLHDRFLTAFSARSRDDQDRMVRTLQDIAGMMGADALDAAPLLDIGPADAPPSTKQRTSLHRD